MSDKNKQMADIEELFAIDLPIEANYQLPDATLLNYYKLRANRIMEIRKDIDESLFNEMQQIILWNIEDKDIPVEKRKPIILLVQSYGGDMSSCFAMLDVMKLSKTKIITVAMQAVMSAGALIFINGHKRLTMPMSNLLLHSGSGQVQGSFSDIQAHNENYVKMVEAMKKNVEQHSTFSKQKLNQVFKKESFFYADDQIKYGLADEIITDISQIIF